MVQGCCSFSDHLKLDMSSAHLFSTRVGTIDEHG